MADNRIWIGLKDSCFAVPVFSKLGVWSESLNVEGNVSLLAEVANIYDDQSFIVLNEDDNSWDFDLEKEKGNAMSSVGRHIKFKTVDI